jgi:hypothetical protein
MIKEIEIVCPPGQQDDQEVLKKLTASALNISPQKITAVQTLKRSIDARGRRVVYRMQVKAYIDEVRMLKKLSRSS